MVIEPVGDLEGRRSGDELPPALPPIEINMPRKASSFLFYWSSRTKVFPLGLDDVGKVPMAMAPE
jgi:hypothetical protein